MAKTKRRLGLHETSVADSMYRQGLPIRQIAETFNVNRPSILKSLGQWKKKVEVDNG